MLQQLGALAVKTDSLDSIPPNSHSAKGMSLSTHAHTPRTPTTSATITMMIMMVIVVKTMT